MTELRDTVPRRVLPLPGRPDFRIHVIADDALLARILNKETVAQREKNAAMKSYEPGEIVVGVPAASIDWMTEHGWICEENGDDDVYAAAELIADHKLDVSMIEPTGACGMVSMADLQVEYPEVRALVPVERDPNAVVIVPTSDVTDETGGEAPQGPAMSNAAAELIAEHGLDPDLIAGSGTDGKITKPDVLEYLEVAE